MNPIYQHVLDNTQTERRSGFTRRQLAPRSFSGTERRRAIERRNSSVEPSNVSAHYTNLRNGALLKRVIRFFKGNNGGNGRNTSQFNPSEQPGEVTHLVDRAYDRIDIESPVSIQDSDTFDVYPGTLYNYSQAGMYVETESTPRINSGVVIQMQNYAPNATAPEYIRKYYGQVRWRRKLSGMVVFVNYGVGIKLCSDLDEFIKTFGL